MPIKDLNPAERFIWEWMNGRLSGFKMALLNVIRVADVQNLDKLSLGFPDEVEGFHSYRHQRGWWDAVQVKAGKGLCRSCAKANHDCIRVAEDSRDDPAFLEDCDYFESKEAAA